MSNYIQYQIGFVCLLSLSPLLLQVKTEVEIIVAMNYLPIIIGSGIGGLVLLVLIIVLLYKVRLL